MRHGYRISCPIGNSTCDSLCRTTKWWVQNIRLHTFPHWFLLVFCRVVQSNSDCGEQLQRFHKYLISFPPLDDNDEVKWVGQRRNEWATKLIDRNWCFRCGFLPEKSPYRNQRSTCECRVADKQPKSLRLKVFGRQQFCVHSVRDHQQRRSKSRHLVFVCINFVWICVFFRRERGRETAIMSASWKLLADIQLLPGIVRLTIGATVCTRPKSTFALNFIIEWWRRRRWRQHCQHWRYILPVARRSSVECETLFAHCRFYPFLFGVVY